MTRFISLYRNDPTIINHIKEELTADIAEAYTHVVSYNGEDLMRYLQRIAVATGERFIFIITRGNTIKCRKMRYISRTLTTGKWRKARYTERRTTSARWC